MAAATFPLTSDSLATHFEIAFSSPLCESTLESSFSYNALIQNLSPIQKQELQHTLSVLPSPDVHIDEISSLMQNFDPNSHLLDTANYPYYALLGVEKNRISKDDFSVLMYYWALRKKLHASEIKSIPIFSGADATSEARDLLDPTFFFHPHPISKKDKESDDRYELLDAYQKLAFYEKLSHISPMQRQFFLIPDVPICNSEGDKVRSVTNRLQTEIGFNVFGRVTVNGREMRIIPSFGMMQTYLDVKHGNRAARLDPCFGATTNESIENKIPEYKRVLATPFPLFPLPEKADSFYADEIDFVIHDFFHAEMFSLIPLKDRTKFLEFLVLLKEHGKAFPNHLEYCQYLHEAIIDMEFGSYREHRVKKFVKRGSPHIFGFVFRK